MTYKVISPRILQKSLYRWHRGVTRELPWKNTKDAYKIWLSEIILQQTRVKQGVKYYNRFVTKYPSVNHLAAASEDEILSDWKGLGYYARARNMKKTALLIVHQYHGNFPSEYNQLLSLPGVGNYTAAAIASFAFDKAFAVLDGNVFRVLSRIFGCDIPIDTQRGKNFFQEKAQTFLDKKDPAQYNQSIMDFGALHCLPRKPKCDTCPLNNYCVAYKSSEVKFLPVKRKNKDLRKRTFHFLIVRKSGQYLLEQRQEKDIWKGLYQPPMIESTEKDIAGISVKAYLKDEFQGDIQSKFITKMNQRLSHQLIEGRFYLIDENELALENQGIWKSIEEIHQLATPKIVTDFFIEYG